MRLGALEEAAGAILELYARYYLYIAIENIYYLALMWYHKTTWAESLIFVQAVNSVVIKAIGRELDLSWVPVWKVWNWSCLIHQHSISLTLPRVWFGTNSLSFLQRDLWVAAQRISFFKTSGSPWGWKSRLGRLPEWSLFWTPKSDTMWGISELYGTKCSVIVCGTILNSFAKMLK